MDQIKSQIVIPYVIKDYIKNKEFKLSKCTQFRDFYIDDYIDLLFKILKSNIGMRNF